MVNAADGVALTLRYLQMHRDGVAIKYAAGATFRIYFIEKYRLFWMIQKKGNSKEVRHNIQHYTERAPPHSHTIVNSRNYLNILCSV